MKIASTIALIAVQAFIAVAADDGGEQWIRASECQCNQPPTKQSPPITPFVPPTNTTTPPGSSEYTPPSVPTSPHNETTVVPPHVSNHTTPSTSPETPSTPPTGNSTLPPSSASGAVAGASLNSLIAGAMVVAATVAVSL